MIYYSTMVIRELWIAKKDEYDNFYADNEGYAEFEGCTVISIGKKGLFVEGKQVSEFIAALVYYENGIVGEVALEENFIKLIIDERSKTQEPVAFSKPRFKPPTGRSRTSGREYNNPEDS